MCQTGRSASSRATRARRRPRRPRRATTAPRPPMSAATSSHSSSQVSRCSGGAGSRPRTPPRARGATAWSASVARLIHPDSLASGQQVVDGEVLEGIEALGDGVDVLVTVEETPPPCARRGRPRGHARGRARWRARNQSAVHSPSPRIAVEPRLHLVVGQRGERVEVEVGAREPDDVLGLPPREAEREELVLVARRHRLPRRERVRVLAARRRSARSSGCGSRTPRRARPAAP